MDEMANSASYKARLVWGVADVYDGWPLNDEEANELGRELEWAARWRETAGSTPPPRKRERMISIEGCADKLEQLLIEHPGTASILGPGRDVPALLGWILELRALGIAASGARAHRSGAAHLKRAFGSPEQLFISQLALALPDPSAETILACCEYAGSSTVCT